MLIASVLIASQILDWYKKNKPGPKYEGDEDPGVQSVKQIFDYYKQHGYNTIVMGASFRNVSSLAPRYPLSAESYLLGRRERSRLSLVSIS